MMKKRMWMALLVGLWVGVGLADDGDNSTFGIAWCDNPNDSVYADSSYYQYIRSTVVGTDLDQDGNPEVIITDYKNGGRVHVFEVVGDNNLQEVWTFSGPGPTGYTSTARSVTTGDIDGDGKGEILVAMTGAGGDTSRQHVGLWVFEWTGNDNDYQLVAQITEFAWEQGGAVVPDRYRCEDLVAGDFDNDGVQEVMWVNNASTAFDNAYIFSIVGDLPGFYVVNQEFIAKRSDLGWGGSSVSGFVTDLDNDGNTDLIVMVWNNIGLQIIEATGPNTYEVKGYLDNIDTEDRYPFAKIVDAYDMDGDGKPELIIGSLLRSRIHFVKAGADVNTSDLTTYTVEFMVNDSTPMFSILGLRAGDQDHGPGSDAPDIYFTDDYGHVWDLEFTGTDLSDPNSYTMYDLYSDFWSDSTWFDSVWVYYSLIPGVVVALGNDLDGDGQKEIFFNSWEVRSSSDYPFYPLDSGFFCMLEHDVTGVQEWEVHYLNPVDLKVFPVPANNQATIRFTMLRKGEVSVEVYDIAGRRVAELYRGQLNQGNHSLQWNTASLQNGVYFIKVKTPEGTVTTRTLISH